MFVGRERNVFESTIPFLSLNGFVGVVWAPMHKKEWLSKIIKGRASFYLCSSLGGGCECQKREAL